MPETPVTYTISTDTENDKVAPDALKASVTALALASAAFLGIRLREGADEVDCVFDGTLSGADRTTLDTHLAAHDGVEVMTRLLESIKSISMEMSVTTTSAWQVVDVNALTPEFFHDAMTELQLRIVGQCKTTDTGAEIRCVEEKDGAGDVVLTSTPFAVPDTSDGWKSFTIDTDVDPRAGTLNAYRLEARLNAATELTLRGVSIILLKVETSS